MDKRPLQHGDGIVELEAPGKGAEYREVGRPFQVEDSAGLREFGNRDSAAPPPSDLHRSERFSFHFFKPMSHKASA